MARLASAIAQIRAAMVRGDMEGEQEQFKRRESLADRLERESVRRAADIGRKEDLRIRMEDLAENRALQEAFRRDQLNQTATLSREREAGENKRAADQVALRRELAESQERLRRDLAGSRGSGATSAPVTGPDARPAPADPSMERQLRSEFEKDLAPHREIARGYQTVKSSAGLQTPQGDLALMYGLVRMFDPGSVVREGEMATLQSSSSVPESLRAELSRYIGEGRVLPPEVRRKYLEVADQLAGDQRTAFRSMAEQTALRNMRYGVSSEAVISDPYTASLGNDLGRMGGRKPTSAELLQRRARP